eukprot:190945-Chlamydomonas_euryale.AAC.7
MHAPRASATRMPRARAPRRELLSCSTYLGVREGLPYYLPCFVSLNFAARVAARAACDERASVRCTVLYLLALCRTLSVDI